MLDTTLSATDVRSLTSPPSAPNEDALLLPMVITKVDAVYGCVSALTEDGRWLLPEPVLLGDIEGDQPYYAYGRPVRCRLAPSTCADRRPEDRELIERLPIPTSVAIWSDDVLEHWLSAHCDANVAATFAGERSVGLIRAVPERLYLLRSTQQRYLVRLAFRDGAGQQHDWVVPDVSFTQQVLDLMRNAADPDALSARLLHGLQSTRMFLAVVLTKPINRARGIIRGCQPLVGGVHTFPPYSQVFAEVVAAAAS